MWRQRGCIKLSHDQVFGKTQNVPWNKLPCVFNNLLKTEKEDQTVTNQRNLKTLIQCDV